MQQKRKVKTDNYFPPYWDAAAMNGALAGYAATPDGMVEPSINYVTNKMVSALIGALTVTAGKVIFNWIPRIQHVNPAAMLNLGSGPETKRGGSGEFDLSITYVNKGNNGQGGTAVQGYYNTYQGDKFWLNGGNTFWKNDLI